MTGEHARSASAVATTSRAGSVACAPTVRRGSATENVRNNRSNSNNSGNSWAAADRVRRNNNVRPVRIRLSRSCKAPPPANCSRPRARDDAVVAAAVPVRWKGRLRSSRTRKDGPGRRAGLVPRGHRVLKARLARIVPRVPSRAANAVRGRIASAVPAVPVRTVLPVPIAPRVRNAPNRVPIVPPHPTVRHLPKVARLPAIPPRASASASAAGGAGVGAAVKAGAGRKANRREFHAFAKTHASGFATGWAVATTSGGAATTRDPRFRRRCRAEHSAKPSQRMQ
jgi:hypothetical protein